jgi:hypothetical protein
MIEGEVSIPPLAPDLNKQFEVICKCVRNLGTTFGAGRFISRHNGRRFQFATLFQAR